MGFRYSSLSAPFSGPQSHRGMFGDSISEFTDQLSQENQDCWDILPLMLAMLIGGAMAIMREISKEPDRVLLGAVLSVSSVLATSVEISNSLASHIIKKAAIVLKWIYPLYTSLFISWLYLPSRSLKRLLLYAQLPALLAFSINQHCLFQYTIHLPSVVLCFAFSSLVSLEIYQRS